MDFYNLLFFLNTIEHKVLVGNQFSIAGVMFIFLAHIGCR